MAQTFDGEVIIITGAASGIGRATAQRLASQGATLALLDIKNTALDALLGSLPSPAGTGSLSAHQTYTCDVSSSAAVDTVVAAVASSLGHIDFLFNCAGINPTALTIGDTTDAYFERLVGTNLRGPYNLTRAVAPHLRSGGAIVNVASTAGLRVTSGFSIYCATKFGLIGFTKAMALELGARGVRVNAVAPGPIDTPTMAGNVAGGDANEKLVERIAMGRLGEPEEVADVVAFLFSDAARFVNGAVLEVHGGMK